MVRAGYGNAAQTYLKSLMRKQLSTAASSPSTDEKRLHRARSLSGRYWAVSFLAQISTSARRSVGPGASIVSAVLGFAIFSALRQNLSVWRQISAVAAQPPVAWHQPPVSGGNPRWRCSATKSAPVTHALVTGCCFPRCLLRGPLRRQVVELIFASRWHRFNAETIKVLAKPAKLAKAKVLIWVGEILSILPSQLIHPAAGVPRCINGSTSVCSASRKLGFKFYFPDPHSLVRAF